MNAAGPRIAVIGGGISGLAAAHWLIEQGRVGGNPLHVSLFESSPRCGGTIHSERMGDYLVELGSDSFITNKPAAIDLCRRLGLENELVGTDPRFRRTLVLSHGKPVPVPQGFALLEPTRLWPILTSPLFTPLGKLRIAMERMIPRGGKQADESVASFVRRRLGREALDRLVQPLVGGIYTSDPQRLSLAATLPRFLEAERRHGSLSRARRLNSASRETEESESSGARFALFASLKSGLSTLCERLLRRIEEGGGVRVHARVAEIHSGPSTGGYELDLVEPNADGRRLPFDAVIVALPVHIAASVIESFDAELARGLGEIEFASSAIVVSGHRLADIAHPMDAAGLIVPSVEGRSVLSVSFASRKFADRAPEGKILLRTFVGGALQPELLARDDNALTQMVLKELGEILGVRGSPEFTVVSRHERGMPQYTLGHLERIARIEALANRHRGLALAGNAYRGVGIPDCIASGESAAERVLHGLVRSVPRE